VFDVGFSEVLLIAVVALLVVGPREFPTLVRNVGGWLGRARQFMNAVKTEFDREIHKADEIKRLMAKEVEIAERHRTLDLDRRADRPTPAPAKPLPREDHSQPDLFQGDKPPPAIAAETARSDHGPAQS
jgi:sec-independent protein translocase protein TatB